MSKAIQRLTREHRDLNSLLDVLERQLEALLRAHTPDFELMRDIVYYLTEYPDQDHHPFEDLIFDRLAERTPQAARLVQSFHHEHRQLATCGQQVLRMIEDLCCGDIRTRAEVHALGSTYVTTYRAHMQREEGEIFAHAEAHLTAADWREIETAFHWRPDPLFGPKVGAEFKALHDWIFIETAQRSTDDAGDEYCAACSTE